MRIGITGSSGLLGFHLRAYLHRFPEFTACCAARDTLSDPHALQEFVSACDAIVHLAGLNRGDDQSIENTNIGLTENLVAACDRAGARPHIVFASSTQATNDTAYGRSKRRCGEILRSWANRSGGTVANLILPHVFGEFGRPFHNSVVSTFCHQLARSETPKVIRDSELELVHAQQVSQIMLENVRQRAGGELRVSGSFMRVAELRDRLSMMHRSYRAMQIPDLRRDIDASLFNTYRSYLFPESYPVTVPCHDDARGRLFETVRTLNGGQAFLSTTRPGITRGNHYHSRKLERFFVVSGCAVIRLRRLFESSIVEFAVEGRVPCYIDMPTFHTHSITNTGTGELTTMFWASEPFDPDDPDTYAEAVEAPCAN